MLVRHHPDTDVQHILIPELPGGSEGSPVDFIQWIAIAATSKSERPIAV